MSSQSQSTDRGTFRQYVPKAGHFPWPAIVAVTLALFVNNFAITNVFPYVGLMVTKLGASPSKEEAGFSSGFSARGLPSPGALLHRSMLLAQLRSLWGPSRYAAAY